MSYGAKCWTMKVDNIKKLDSTEMRMLRLMCGITLRDRIKIEKIRMIIGMELTNSEFLRNQRLRWFGHVERMIREKASEMALDMKVNGKKVGRPKKWQLEVIWNDMKNKKFV